MKRFNISVNGQSYDVQVEELNGSVAAAPAAPSVAAAAPVAAPAPKAAPTAAPAPKAAAPAGGTKINAPMPGSIVDVKVAVGQVITKGSVLVVLEAMKMENEIMAPHDGKISSILVKKGDTVNSNDALLTIE